MPRDPFADDGHVEPPALRLAGDRLRDLVGADGHGGGVARDEDARHWATFARISSKRRSETRP